METYVINIDGEEFTGAPTMTTEEVNKAFDAAVEEWPEVRREHEKKSLLASIMRGIGGDRMSVETGLLDEEVELSYTAWEIRHGVVVQHGKEGNKLTAWTKDGRITGPEIKYYIDKSEDGDFSIRIRHEKVTQALFREGILERYIITINDKEYIGAPTYTKKGAEAAFEAVVAEKSSFKGSRLELRAKIKKLKSLDAGRMHYAIHLLTLDSWRIAREYEAKHGVVGNFFRDDEKFHFGAWIQDGLIIGPLAE